MALPIPLVAVPNVTAHSSMASIPITVLLYDGPLLRGFNMVIKGLMLMHLDSNLTVARCKSFAYLFTCLLTLLYYLTLLEKVL